MYQPFIRVLDGSLHFASSLYVTSRQTFISFFGKNPKRFCDTNLLVNSLTSVAQPAGVKGLKFRPLLRSWGPFSIQCIKYCNLSLSKFNENKRSTCFGGPTSGLQRSILSPGGHPRLKRAQSKPERSPSKVKLAKNDYFFILGRVPRRRALKHQ